jgi:hypothetical protein
VSPFCRPDKEEKAMKTARILAFSGAALIVATSAAFAAPTHVARLDTLVTAPDAQIEPVHYRKKRHHHYARRAPNPVRGVVGTAGGLAGVGVNTAVGTANVLGHGWCDFWGYCR